MPEARRAVNCARPEPARFDRRFFVLLAAAALLPLARRALAWVPPAEFPPGRIAHRRKNVKTLSVKGIRTFIGRNVEGGKQDVAETILVNATNGACRLEARLLAGSTSRCRTARSASPSPKGRPARSRTTRALERLLFTSAGKDELTQAVQAFGIRPDVTGLGWRGFRVLPLDRLLRFIPCFWPSFTQFCRRSLSVS